MRSIRVSDSTIPPSIALAAPESPDRAPCGTTGTRCAEATRSTCCTSSVDVGRTTASGDPDAQKAASSWR
jgi:ApbE superfamily uncharacterized protein (UPF0280 family)